MAMRPNVPYDPSASVAPDVQAPNDQIRVEASPQDFGSQIGGAMQQAGQTSERIGDQATDVAIQQQGMINESLATNADISHASDIGAIKGKMHSLQGLDAVQALPDTIAQINASRDKTLASLPTAGAQRAFAQLSARTTGYALSDVNEYAATQVKAADLASAQALTTNAAQSAGDLSVAKNDQRFNNSLQDIDFGVTRMMQNKGYGSVMQQDPNTGAVSFDESTPQGQGAKQVYTQLQNEAHGVAWENRIHALADDPNGGNVAAAQAAFDANRSNIPPEAQMKIAAYLQPKMRAYQASGVGSSAISAADQGYTSYVEGAAGNASPAGSAPLVDRIDQAIHGQESGGAANSPTSINGAVGGHQILPATFAQYAKPGESIDSAGDNATVGKRIIADYTQKYAGDPARVAVAYFSGPGNVSPPGSAVPYINDAKDGNGKSTSSYVQDVLGKMGGAGGLQTKADYYRTNYATILDHARSQADALHPDDPTFSQQAMARVQQQMDASIRQQDISYKADNDTVYQAFNGDLSKGTRPISVDQLRATSPTVAQAWDRLQSQQPQVAHDIATKILSENAKNNGGDAKTYGAGYYDVFNRIHAADGDPSKINDSAALYGMVGQPGGLTMAGLEKARGEIAGKNTPDAEAESAQRSQFFRDAHAQITGSNEKLGLTDPKGEEIYARFMASAYQHIDAAKASGKTPAQIYSPDSPDYVGKSIATFKRPMNVWMSDMMNQNGPTGGLTPAAVDTGATDLKSKDGIISAYRGGKLSRADAGKALVAGGFAMAAVAPPPAAPAEPVVPVN